jgi:hypothetical protein
MDEKVKPLSSSLLTSSSSSSSFFFFKKKKIIYLFIRGIPRPYNCNVPRSLNDWHPKVVVEPSKRSDCVPEPKTNLELFLVNLELFFHLFCLPLLEILILSSNSE